MMKNTTKPITKATKATKATKPITKAGKVVKPASQKAGKVVKPASQKAGKVTRTVSKKQARTEAEHDKTLATIRVTAMSKLVKSAADRRDLDSISAATVASESATSAIIALATGIAKRRTWEALVAGTPNPNVPVLDPATGKRFTKEQREAMKDAAANPFLRYLWFKAQADGCRRKTASNIITIIRNIAKANGVVPKVHKANKDVSTIRIVKVQKPGELDAGMGLEAWVIKQADEYPSLAAYLLPALKSYLGEASEQGETE